jgi:hypothetical protein
MGNADVERVFRMRRNPKVRGSAGHVLAGGPCIHPIEPLGYEHFIDLRKVLDLPAEKAIGFENNRRGS